LAFSRRLFLRSGALAAAACVSNPLLALGGRRPIGGEEESDPSLKLPSVQSGNWEDHAGALDRLERNAFAGAVGSSFKVFLTPDSSPVWVTLQSVEDLPQIVPVNPASFAVMNRASSVAPATSGFVLVFGGSSELPQGTYLFEHDGLGTFALFTVPNGNGQQLYTGVVNRLESSFIVAVPYSQGQATGTARNRTAGATVTVQGLSDPAATSSAIESPAHGPAGNPGAQRGAVRD
jgi:uncharacterized protein DUF6916